MGESLAIELAYARPDVQRIVVVEVPQGTTAREALRRSGLASEFPEIDVAACPLGVFGTPVDEGYVVQANDRVEVYRPLDCDPRDTRRELAARGKTMRR